MFFARREGADGFVLPVALKVFSPEPYRTPAAYAEAIVHRYSFYSYGDCMFITRRVN